MCCIVPIARPIAIGPLAPCRLTRRFCPGERLVGWVHRPILIRGSPRYSKRSPLSLFVLSDYSAPTTQIAMRLLTRRKKRWVFWGEVPGFNQRGRLGSLLRQQLQRPIAKGATAIAAIGSEAVDAYQTLFPRIRVFNIPYFCDLAHFRTAATERWTRRKRTVDVLFSGQLIERKGVDLLIRAFAQIADQVPELRLQLLGTGPALDVLRGMIPFGLARSNPLPWISTTRCPARDFCCG